MGREELADHYGELDRQVTLFEPTMADHKAAKDRLVEMAKSDPAEKGVLITGAQYRVQLGACKNERTITDQPKAWRAVVKGLGNAGAIAAVTIPLGVIDKVVVLEEQQKLFLVKAQTGSRSIEVVALRPHAA